MTSPLVRARQTAQILTDIAGWPQAAEASELLPGEPAPAVLALLGKHHDRRVAVVGHQPGLGDLLALCLLGSGKTLPVEIKKNAILCVSFQGSPRAGHGVLEWLATPRMLRGLGRG